MLKNAPTLAIVAVDTAENEPLKISLVHFISSIPSLNATHQRRFLLRTTSRIGEFRIRPGLDSVPTLRIASYQPILMAVL